MQACTNRHLEDLDFQVPCTLLDHHPTSVELRSLAFVWHPLLGWLVFLFSEGFVYAMWVCPHECRWPERTEEGLLARQPLYQPLSAALPTARLPRAEIIRLLNNFCYIWKLKYWKMEEELANQNLSLHSLWSPFTAHEGPGVLPRQPEAEGPSSWVKAGH